MARRLRLQFPGAMYHVINRGNYRRDVFETAGAAKAFEQVLDETCEQFGWRLHAYVIMRNHFHLALETPEPNLVDGMHWLQSTYAVRFNRFRAESGHLFQGRYQSLLIEDATALARVVNYIHLNPVRAKIVEPMHVAGFRWSSLARFIRRDTPKHLVASPWLTQLGLTNSPDGWRAYTASLIASVDDIDSEREHHELCRGWAIGTHGWRVAIAKDHAHLALHRGVASHEARDIKRAHWMNLLERLLRDSGKTIEHAQRDQKGAAWKRVLAEKVRADGAAAHAWIAETLAMGTANSVRSYVSRERRLRNQQLSA